LGSHVCSESESDLGARLGEAIRVVQGEVLFDILHRAGRCVEVWAGKARITDIGTRFDVTLTDEKTTGAVIDGGVELAALDARSRSFCAREGVAKYGGTKRRAALWRTGSANAVPDRAPAF